MKIFAGLIVGLVVGFLLGELNSSPVAPPPVAHQTWAENGIWQISKSGDSDQQLAEAEKYYGKAVVLFLAGVARQAAAPSVAGNPVTTEESDTDPEHLSSQPAELVQETTKVETVSTKALNRKEKIAAEAAAKKDENLKRLIAFQKSEPAKTLTPEVRKMIGSFEGTFTQVEGKNKGRVDHVEMEFNLSMQDGKLMGAVRVLLSTPDGTVYSNSRGDGANQTLRPVEGQKDQIYVQTSPGSFMLLDLKNPNQLQGRYYDSAGAYFGPVRVWRK